MATQRLATYVHYCRAGASTRCTVIRSPDRVVADDAFKATPPIHIQLPEAKAPATSLTRERAFSGSTVQEL